MDATGIVTNGLWTEVQVLYVTDIEVAVALEDTSVSVVSEDVAVSVVSEDMEVN